MSTLFKMPNSSFIASYDFIKNRISIKIDELVVCHPFIIGELACGHLKNREEIISLLKSLPKARTVENDEILYFIENRKLMGLGIGLIDVHLLASSLLTDSLFWTADKQLSIVGSKLNILYREE